MDAQLRATSTAMVLMILCGCRSETEATVEQQSAQRFALQRRIDATGEEKVYVCSMSCLSDPNCPQLCMRGMSDNHGEVTESELSSYCKSAKEEADAVGGQNYVVIVGPARRKVGNAWLVYVAACFSNLTVELDVNDVNHVEFAGGKEETWPLVLKKSGGYALDFTYIDGGKKVRINKVVHCTGAVPSRNKGVRNRCFGGEAGVAEQSRRGPF
jgi:hypothetical protein